MADKILLRMDSIRKLIDIRLSEMQSYQDKYPYLVDLEIRAELFRLIRKFADSTDEPAFVANISNLAVQLMALSLSLTKQPHRMTSMLINAEGICTSEFYFDQIVNRLLQEHRT